MFCLNALPVFIQDRFVYRHIYKKLFWFKKHTGFGWVQGQNFGDYLSLVVVGEIARRKKISFTSAFSDSDRKLLAVGSVLHFACNGDVIWGSGVNGKIAPERHVFDQLDVRMVRGPLTRNYLQQKGMNVAECYGDPALLLPDFFPEFSWKPTSGKVTVIPHMNELEYVRKNIPSEMTLLSPCGYWKKIVREIITSELVLSSSLHGIIVAEAFGVPVRFVMPSGDETLFKFQDYYEGTNRVVGKIPAGFAQGITAHSGIEMPLLQCSQKAMLAAFPLDLFEV